MKLIAKIGWYAIRDIMRNKWGLLYFLFFFLATCGLFQLEAQSGKVTISLISITLLLIPLVSLLFGIIYFYNSREFVELLLCQPVRRWTVYIGMYIGLAASLIFAFVTGVLIPYVLFGALTMKEFPIVSTLIGIGSILTAIYIGIAFCIATWFEDKSRGLAIGIGVWLFCALLYDGLVLMIAYTFADYPLETPMLSLMFANPIDLARVILMLKADIAALMGYTGAVFIRFFGSGTGTLAAVVSLLIWSALPLMAGLRRFRKKDF